ncbi:MAG: glycosyltransferase [Lachnospiraceae bacterium]|nr:glycosyltransferase [Lachnospiraceae bacterium]
MKKVTVIIPCYNVDTYLDRCWESLRRQTIGIENLECIFVNDESTDGGYTLSKLEEIERQQPESVIVVDLSENGGPGNARNIGLEYAGAKYVQFLDADDELREDTCLKLFEEAEKNRADIIQFNHLYILNEQKRSSANSRENRLYVINGKEDRIPFLNATKVTYGCTNKFYNIETIREARVAFPTGLRYEEPLFVYPLFLYADRVMLLNEDFYLYYFRQGSMVTSQLGKKLLDHPRVQLMLLEYLMERADLFSTYKDIIEIYFLWSFYCETLSFAAGYADAYLPLEFFAYMQEVCRAFFPEWRKNPHIGMIPKEAVKALDMIDTGFESQDKLDEFIVGLRGKF